MELLKKAENSLAGVYKGAPKLSNSTKETLVKIWPWLAVIGGVLQLLSGLWLFRWARAASDLTNSVNEFYRAIGATQIVEERFSVWVWISLVMLVVEGILLLMAFPKLQKRLKAGWDLLFLVGLLNVVYAVISLFISGYSGVGGGFGGLIWNLLVSAVVFWLLFAVRDKYKGADFTFSDKKDGK